MIGHLEPGGAKRFVLLILELRERYRKGIWKKEFFTKSMLDFRSVRVGRVEGHVEVERRRL